VRVRVRVRVRARVRVRVSGRQEVDPHVAVEEGGPHRVGAGEAHLVRVRAWARVGVGVKVRVGVRVRVGARVRVRVSRVGAGEAHGEL
jgi:hypothetical protein